MSSIKALWLTVAICAGCVPPTGDPHPQIANDVAGVTAIASPVQVNAWPPDNNCAPSGGHNPCTDAGERIDQCVFDLPGSGGICDARGFGGSTQYISSPVTLGTKTKTVTLLVDTATAYQCTIATGADCIRLAGKASIVGSGASGNSTPAGCTFGLAATAQVSSLLTTADHSVVTPHLNLRDFSICGNQKATVAEALVDFQGVTDESSVSDLLMFNLPAAPALRIRNLASGGGSGPIAFRNITVNGPANAATNTQPILVEAVAGGGLIAGISFDVVTVNREGTGNALVEINGHNLDNGTAIMGVTLDTVYCEPGHTGDPCIRIVDAQNVIGHDIVGGNGGGIVGDVVQISESTTGNVRGVVFTGLRCQSPCTNVVDDEVNGLTYSERAMSLYTFPARVANVSAVVLGGCRHLTGAGDPNGVVVGRLCDVYLNTLGGIGTTLYVKEADAGAATGWAAK